jgi:hypothetical protein
LGESCLISKFLTNSCLISSQNPRISFPLFIFSSLVRASAPLTKISVSVEVAFLFKSSLFLFFWFYFSSSSNYFLFISASNYSAVSIWFFFFSFTSVPLPKGPPFAKGLFDNFARGLLEVAWVVPFLARGLFNYFFVESNIFPFERNLFPKGAVPYFY